MFISKLFTETDTDRMICNEIKMRKIEALWLVVLDFRTPLYIYIV